MYKNCTARDDIIEKFEKLEKFIIEVCLTIFQYYTWKG